MGGTPEQGEPPTNETAPHAGPKNRRVVGTVAGGVRSFASLTARGVTRTVHYARGAARAQGAGETGLFRLIELHAFNAAGDAAVAISLAGTIFFAEPGEARDKVALFLGLTMLPFAIVAPLLGPFLDRFSHGRRWAIGATMAFRAFMVWLLADAVASDSLMLFPTALGCLVASKAYGVARAATVPRLLPDELTLVKANSRISLAGVVGAAVSAPLAGLALTFGAQWSLRCAFIVFAAATILAVLLPQQVDAVVGEKQLALRKSGHRLTLPGTSVFALRCNAGLRVLSGFLTMFMAFLLRQHPLPGWQGKEALLIGVVVGAAGMGNTLGIAASAALRRLDPAKVVMIALLADIVATVLAAVFFGLLTATLLGLTAGIAQAMGKLSLDATIQRDVPEDYRTSAFARSETLLQLSWVIGGFLGIAMPLIAPLALGVLAALMTGWAALVVLRGRTQQHAAP